MTRTLLVGGLLIALFGAASAAESGRRIHRWVDEEGRVHFGDVVPPSQAKQGRTELDERGLKVREVERAKTKEEIAEERRQAEIRAVQERIARERAEQDRILLDTYSSLEVMEQVRDAKLATISGQIRLTENNLAALRKQADELMARAASLERSGRPVPEALQKDILSTQGQIQRHLEFIVDKQKEQEVIRDQFARDMARYREITEKRAEEARSGR
ncbi:MAG: hypothetical protein Kow006_03410 [Gammaproteobacteria bacterium]